MAKVETYFREGIESVEQIEQTYGPIYDATTLSKVADCPRKHQIRVEENLTRPGASAPMVMGIAMHEGLEYYYAHPERTKRIEEEAIQVAIDTWHEFDIDRAHMDPKYAIFDENHIETILQNYYRTWTHERIEIFTPINGLTIDDLDLSDVLAAKFKLTDDGYIILGESNLIMLYEVDGEDFLYAGKPDLPVRDQAGWVYVMDHKTTSGYLSDWWAKQFEVSNKLRGYMAMVQSLLGETPVGAVINGIYVGKYAANPDSKATKFHRYSFDFSPDHITEALRNQKAWADYIDFCRERDYFPQGCGFGGCSHPDICRRDPDSRAVVKQTDYIDNPRTFWDL